ncbi:MAG: hypothetical protein ACLPUH_01805 [Steroidobacteraceae bacterium]
MLKDNALTELLQGALAVYGFELWGFELNSFEGNRRLQVYIETPNGVTLDDCERASQSPAKLPRSPGRQDQPERKPRLTH